MEKEIIIDETDLMENEASLEEVSESVQKQQKVEKQEAKKETEKKEKPKAILEEQERIYFEFINKILKKIHVVCFDQLKVCLINKFKLDDVSANTVIWDAQRYNYLFISQDGYVMRTGYYLAVTEDKFRDGIDVTNYKFYIKYDFAPLIMQEDRTLIKAFTVIANMMPASEDFVVATDPWCFAFVPSDEAVKNGVPAVCYQVGLVPHEALAGYCYMLSKEERIEKEELQNGIKRIVVVTNSSDALSIPEGVGITRIVTTTSRDFTIVEERENPWED